MRRKLFHRSGRARAGLLGLALAAAAVGGARADTLVLWDNYSAAEQSTVIDGLVKQFEAANPGVTVERTSRTLEDLSLTLKLTLSSGQGPMVAQVNQGAGDMGALVAAGLLRPLDPWMKRDGVAKGVSASALQRNQWTKDGVFGAGDTYGVAPLGELVGLYYNAATLQKAGVAVPTTFEEFEDALAALKGKGVVPMMLGNADGVSSMQIFALVQQLRVSAGDRKAEDDLVYGRGGSFQGPSFVESAKTLLAWKQAGYFFPGFEGVSADDAANLFGQGQAAFMISGSWYTAQLQGNPDIRFIQLPPRRGVDAPLVEGGTDLALCVTATAKTQAQQDLAAKFIGFMTSEPTAETLANAGMLPDKGLENPDKVKTSALLGDIFKVWQKLNTENALGHYLDWASPSMFKTLTENMPQMLAGRTTPEQALAAADADYQAYVKSKTAQK